MAQKKIQGITAKLGLDASGVISALNEIDKKSKSVASEMKEVDKSLKMDPSNTVLMAQKQELLAEAAANTANKLRELESVSEKMDKAFAANPEWERQYEPIGAAIDETRNKLKELRKQQGQVEEDFASGKISGEKYKAFNDELQATKNKMKELEQQKKDLEKSFVDGHISAEEYRAFQRELENTRNELRDFENQQEEAARGFDDLGDAAKKTGKNLNNAADDTKKYEKALEDLKTAAGKVGDDLRSIGEAAAAGIAVIGAAAATGIAEATKVGSTFEKSMSKVQALSGATAEEYEALSSAAQHMGATTSKTAAQSADALGYMALAGWDTQQMLSGLEPILRASEAGEMDLARTSDLVTDSMSALGVGVQDLNHYLDVVTKAQSSANTSMEGLLQAYIGAGGMLKTLNVPLEESAAIMGVLANRGIKASEAGNSLNSILINLVGANKNAASAMDTLGVSAWDSEGNFIGLTETLKQLDVALKEANNDQKVLFEAQIGGRTQFDTLQALISGVSEEYDDLHDSLMHADGALLKTAKTMQDNLLGDVTTLGSALEDLGIKVYDKFREPFREAVQTATKEISNLSSSAEKGKLSDSLERIAGGLSKLLKSGAEFAADKGIPTLIKSLDWITENGDKIAALVEAIGAGWLTWKIGSMAGHVVNLVEALKKYNAAAATATAEQTALNTAMKANIYAIVATAAITLATAIGKLIAAQIDNAAAAMREKNRLDETTVAIREKTQAYKDAAQAAKEEADEEDRKAQLAENYWKQLQKLVDEEGNVIGSGEQVEDLVNRINTITGESIQVIDGQIQGYKDLTTTLYDYIKAKQIEAKIEAYGEEYIEAVENIEDANKRYKEAYNQFRVNQSRMLMTQNAIATMKARGEGVSTNKEYMDLLEKADEFEAATNEYLVQSNSLKEIVDEYQNTIDTVNGLYDEQKNIIQSGTEEVTGAIEDEGDDYDDTLKKMAEDRDKALQELDGTYKIHGKTDDEYWAEKLSILETYRDESSEEWWKLYDEVQKHYEKLSETEATALKKAEKEQEEAIKNYVTNKFRDLETEQLIKGYDDSWLNEQKRNIIEELDYNTDLYKEYNLKLLQEQKKAGEDMAKADQKLADERKTEAVKNIKEEISEIYKTYETKYKELEKLKETAYKKFMSIGGNVFDFEESGKTTTLTINDIKKQMKEMEAFYNNVKKLKDQGADQSLISEILSMNDKEAQAWAKSLAGMNKAEFENVNKLYVKKSDYAEKLSDMLYSDDEMQIGKDLEAELQKYYDGSSDANNYVDEFISTLRDRDDDFRKAFEDVLGNSIVDILKLNGKKLDIDQTVGEKTAQDLSSAVTNGMAESYSKLSTNVEKSIAQSLPDVSGISSAVSLQPTANTQPVKETAAASNIQGFDLLMDKADKILSVLELIAASLSDGSDLSGKIAPIRAVFPITVNLDGKKIAQETRTINNEIRIRTNK